MTPVSTRLILESFSVHSSLEAQGVTSGRPFPSRATFSVAVHTGQSQKNSE